MPLEILDAVLVCRVVRKHLHAAARTALLKLLEQPDHSPRIEAGLGARVRTFEVSRSLDLTREMQGLQICARTDERARNPRTARQDRQDACSDTEILIFAGIVHDVVMNRVRGLVTKDAGELFLILDELHQRIGHVDVPAGHGERVRLLLVDQNEMERPVVLRIDDRLYAGCYGIEDVVVRRRRNDLAFLLQLLIDLRPDLVFRLIGRRRLQRRANQRGGKKQTQSSRAVRLMLHIMNNEATAG